MLYKKIDIRGKYLFKISRLGNNFMPAAMLMDPKLFRRNPISGFDISSDFKERGLSGIEC